MFLLQSQFKLWIAFSFYYLWIIDCVNGTTNLPLLLKPSEDPFYRIPAGFENSLPGSVLKFREIPYRWEYTQYLNGTLPCFPQNIKKAYQILYRTNDALDNATATVTTVMVPHNADGSKMVSYQVIQDNISSDCAPSYILQKGSNPVDILPQSEMIFMDTLLARGYIVSTPDYQGPKSMFGVGAMAGHSVLDGIRAVLAVKNITRMKSDVQIQMWGYSGGALATGWAAELHPSYAPELDIMSAVIGGTPVDLNATVYSLNRAFFAGLAITGLLGVTNQYPDLAVYIDSVLAPEKKEAFYRVRDLCYGTVVQEYSFQDVISYFNRTNFTEHPAVINAINANKLGNIDTPTIPIFAYHAEHDPITPFELTMAVYDKWCQNGARIELVSDQTLDHSGLILGGVGNAVAYIERRFRGEPHSSRCTHRSTELSSRDPGTLFQYVRIMFDYMKAIIGIAPIRRQH